MRGLSPELRAVVDLARAAQGAYEVRELLRRIVAELVRTFGFERAALYRWAPDRSAVEPLVAHGVPDDELQATPREIDAYPFMQRALETGEPVFVRDVVEERAVAPELAEHFGLRSALVVPLITRGQCLGFIAADRGGEAFELDDETLDVVAAFGVLAAVFLEQRLEREELVRTDTLKSNFIALASHELRTPTAVVHGIAATLQEHGERLPQDRLLQLRRTLYEHTERLRRLVDQLLDLSRLEAEAIVIEPERFSVRARLEEILVTVCGERTPDVELAVSPDLEATADPLAFDRIVSNLITNALRYGSPPVLVSAAQTDRHFRLAVEDRGRGVEPEFVPRLFERFSRSDHSASVGSGGSGLGLSIAKSYANAHGGDLLYEDADPHGARFHLVLPVRPSPR